MTSGGTIVDARTVDKTYATGRGRCRASTGRSSGARLSRSMGPSGCGKTTLLNCLSGLDAIRRGGRGRG
jgi:putative ABC transport system ATP-binding protein